MAPDLDAWLSSRRRGSRVTAESTGLLVIDEPEVFGSLKPGSPAPAGSFIALGSAGIKRTLDVVGQQGLRPQIISVFDLDDAGRQLLADAAWEPEGRMAAMLHPDLARLAAPALPPGLALHPSCPGPAGLPWPTIAQLHRDHDPEWPADDTGLVAHLPLMTMAMLAAVDGEGGLVGAAGVRVNAGSAWVFGVVTHGSWRGQGVATALTGQVLAHAATLGATEAVLEATDLGRGIYERLGFVAVGMMDDYV